MKYPYLLLKQRLEALEGIPDVRWYNAQYDPATDEAVYHVPSVYLEFLEWVPTPGGERVQHGPLSVRVHLMTERWDEDDSLLAHYDLVDAIHAALHDYEGKLSHLPAFAALAGTSSDQHVINRMVRTSVLPDHAQTNTAITIQEYTFHYVDVAAARRYLDAAPVTITLTPDPL